MQLVGGAPAHEALLEAAFGFVSLSEGKPMRSKQVALVLRLRNTPSFVVEGQATELELGCTPGSNRPLVAKGRALRIGQPLGLSKIAPGVPLPSLHLVGRR